MSTETWSRFPVRLFSDHDNIGSDVTLLGVDSEAIEEEKTELPFNGCRPSRVKKQIPYLFLHRRCF